MTKPCVLLVEDENSTREVVAELLINVGYAVTEAYDAEMALGLLKKENLFDLLLTDVHMPGDLNGIDVVLCARLMWPELPVVFVTGRPDVLGSVDVPGPRPGCLAKPYVLGDLLAVIEATSQSQSAQDHKPAAFQAPPVFRSGPKRPWKPTA